MGQEIGVDVGPSFFETELPADATENNRLGVNRGVIAVDRVLRRESLAADLRTMASELDLAVGVKETRVNSSKRDAYRAYYSDRDAEIIGRRLSDDIRLFGYTF